jgi:hypothetical protein
MHQLPQRLRLDPADTLSGYRELLADFFQRVVGVHADAGIIRSLGRANAFSGSVASSFETALRASSG